MAIKKMYTKENVKQMCRDYPDRLPIFDVDLTEYNAKHGIRDGQGSKTYELILYTQRNYNAGLIQFINDGDGTYSHEVDLLEYADKLEKWKKEDPELYKLMNDSCRELTWKSPVEEICRGFGNIDKRDNERIAKAKAQAEMTAESRSYFM